jgi:hypothetical protein
MHAHTMPARVPPRRAPSLLLPLNPSHHVQYLHLTSLHLPMHATVEEDADHRRKSRAQITQTMPMTSRGYAQGRPRTRTGHAPRHHLAHALDLLSTRGASPHMPKAARHALDRDP